MSSKPATAIDRITKSRKVLYDKEHTPDQYVGTYDNFWAETYDQDAQELGFMAWDNAVNAVEKYVPNKDGVILDYCGGTGQVGLRMHQRGYKNLHIADGSIGMLQHALKRNVYKTYHHGIIPKDGVPEYLLDAVDKYDCVLSSMSLSEFEPVVKYIVSKALKVGGVFISLESVPHIEDACLTGIKWILANANAPDRCFEIVCNDDNVNHDRFTDHKMKLLVVRRIK